MASYLIDWNVADRLSVVVGLGRVGQRRAANLLEAGARVLAIDPAASHPRFPRPSGVSILAEPYHPDHLEHPPGGDRPSLVFAAATPDINRLVVADSLRLALPVCSATDPPSGNFTLPAVWRSNALTLAVSTSGASPALARALRDQLANTLGPLPGQFAALLAEIRPIVLQTLPNPSSRRRLMLSWADPSWLHLLASTGPEATRNALLEDLHRLAAQLP